ncbi:hypothetical protein PsorP6_001291 [Peronosclerospora sorghi]|uniref:Uncharacterized protein n=1 Tax=Peronosclerospora sorghi TaxID=230839 RepID=A0ACC0WU53_9STRA|nr:hypothetical protein PsorP6_001291 [Peronosclerospora sorghi]
MNNDGTVEDCLGCRLVGSTILVGVGAFFLNERSKLPRHDLRQRRWLFACAGAFCAAGIGRATTHLFETPKYSSLQDCSDAKTAGITTSSPMNDK